MGEEGSRRFTDREVALILNRATDLDEAEATPVGGGLSLEDLRSIAREVGISPSAIDRAVASLARGGGMGRSWAGAPRVHKAVRALPAELTGEDTARLMSLVDDRVDSTGAITEALGSIRWTGRDRFKSTRVSITPKEGETTIEVVEKAEPKMRRIFHLLPAAWGAMLAGPLVSAVQPTTLGLIAILVLSVAVGLGIGRGAWSLVAAAGDRRVQRLAEELAGAAAAGSKLPGATD